MFSNFIDLIFFLQNTRLSWFAPNFIYNIQKWYIKRFNAAVFENELKWYSTEPEQGKHNYTLADQLLEFVRSNRIVAKGHNIFWENPIYNPKWVLNLTNQELKSAVESRIQSLMSRYLFHKYY